MHRPGDGGDVVDTSKRLDNNAFGDEQPGWYWRGTEGPDLAGNAAQHDAYPLPCERGRRGRLLDELGAGTDEVLLHARLRWRRSEAAPS